LCDLVYSLPAVPEQSCRSLGQSLAGLACKLNPNPNLNPNLNLQKTAASPSQRASDERLPKIACSPLGATRAASLRANPVAPLWMRPREAQRGGAELLGPAVPPRNKHNKAEQSRVKHHKLNKHKEQN